MMDLSIRAGLAGFLAVLANCASAAGIWFSAGDALYRLDPDSNQAILVASPGSAQGLAVDGKDGAAWILLGSRLQKLSEAGIVLADVDLKNFGFQYPAGFSLDPFDSSLWLADGKALARLDSVGSTLGTWSVSGVVRPLSPGVDQSVWLLGNKQLWRYSPQGALLASQDVSAVVKDATKFLAVDSLGNALWLAGEKELIQLNLSNLTQVSASLTSPQTIRGLALDAKRGVLWMLANDTATGFARDGSTVKTVALGALGVTKPVTLAFDAASDSLWLGHGAGLVRFTSGGEPAGSLATANPVSAIGVAPFVLTPSVSILKPPPNALTNNARPEFRLGYDALCTGVSCGFAPSCFASYGLTALLNSQPVGSQFVFDRNTGQAGYTPPQRLPEGTNTFTAQVRDQFGHSSELATNTFAVDTIAPRFLSLTPADGTVLPNANVVIQGTIDDATAAVVLSGSGMTRVGPNFGFPVVLQPGLNTFVLSAVDPAGNTTNATLRLTLASVSVSIDDPVNGVSVNSESVLVTGTFQGPQNTGITVNGVIAAIGGNRFYAQVPLQPGSNVVTATVTAPDGVMASHAITIVSTGAALISVTPDVSYGFASLTVTFTINNNTGRTLKLTEADFNGDGFLDLRTTAPNIQIADFIYSAPGLYKALFKFTDDQNAVYNVNVVVQVDDKVRIDQLLRASWSAFSQALATRDKPAAMKLLTVPAQARYGRVFDALLGSLPAVVASISAPERALLTGTVGEYFVTRQAPDGSLRLFLIYFLRDADGVWRLDTM